jgi:hypothetical protein
LRSIRLCLGEHSFQRSAGWTFRLDAATNSEYLVAEDSLPPQAVLQRESHLAVLLPIAGPAYGIVRARMDLNDTFDPEL